MLYESDNALNLDTMEKELHVKMGSTPGTLWRVAGAGGQRQGGPGWRACVFITFGRVKPGWQFSERASKRWSGPLLFPPPSAA